jgi:hypothetical protein
MLVYVDTNVLNHLHEQKSLSASDVIAVRRAARLKLFRLLASDVLVGEVLATFRSNPSKARGLLTILFDLCDVPNSMIRDRDLLLGGDLRAFCGLSAAPDRFMDPPEASRLAGKLKRLAEGQVDPTILAEAHEEEKKNKREFLITMRAAKKIVEPEAAKLSSPPSFDEYVDRMAPGLLGTLAKTFGVFDECLAQGVVGLRKIPTVQAFLGYTCSMIYSQTIEGKPPDLGDSRDQLHAIVASVADIFVSTDGDLRGHVIRAGIPTLEVLDLPDFIERIR